MLALVDGGVSTPYELKTAAGLSPGATIPVLRRLMDSRLIVPERPGNRGRMNHKITADGRRHLESGWQGLIDGGPSGDLDADLRVALLALWIGGDRRSAAEFLRKSAAKRRESISKVKKAEGPPLLPPIAFWYRRLRSISSEASIKAEFAAALAMARALPRSPTGKENRKHATPGV